MSESVQVVTLEGGELKVPASIGKSREVVLALPLSRLLVKMFLVPADAVEDQVGYVTPKLKALSPYPDEPLKVSCETLRETENGRIVLAMALPEGSADDVATALDEAKLNVTRVDAIALGQLPALVPQLLAGGSPAARRLLLIASADCLSVFVMDGDLPVAVRAVSSGAELRRELMLSLLEAESFAGAVPLAEIATVGEVPSEGLSDLAPVRALAVPAEAMPALAGRALDGSTADALPESWREVLEETRFKRKMRLILTVAGVIWVTLMAVIVGKPKYIDRKIAELKEHQKAQAPQYRAVRTKEQQVLAVRSISDHKQGGLETLRAVVSAIPAEEDFVLSKWYFKRGEYLSFSGESPSGNEKAIRRFKENLSALSLADITGDEDDEETSFFTDVSWEGAIKGGRFALRCRYTETEEEDW